ncbi:MAG: hybrid sensor histidine kinase/response regulator [Chloroflexaceae bacterium]|nr:hybrid sensor histidine kinase/response regulator [Chloroflexaceae bacterium]
MSQTRMPDRILVVDDSADNLYLIQNLLQAEGFEVAAAKNGFEALRLVKEVRPHLILLDIMMPEMDGFEVTRRIRSDGDIPFIPIVLITAYNGPSAVTGLDIGADDFIRKPVDVEELLARVRSLLRLKHSVDERDQIARQREDFVSLLAHDLRTPLIAADRMLVLMEQGALGPMAGEQLEAISIMSRSNRDLLDIVNNLLEVYRYEAGRKTLSFSRVDLRVLAAEVMEELAPLAQEKGLSLKFAPELGKNDQPSALVLGDRLELRRLLTNVLGNGIKFTDSGYVETSISLEKGKNGRSSPKLTLKIQDTGTGITPEDQKQLFDRFSQGKHKRPGSGLGLHLCRQIVESHQGEIEVRSQRGQGSCFIISLPAAPSQAIPEGHRRNLPVKGQNANSRTPVNSERPSQ